MGWINPRSLQGKAYWRKLKGCREIGSKSIRMGIGGKDGKETHLLIFALYECFL